MASKLKRIGHWVAGILKAAAPFVIDPKTKVAIGAAGAVLDAATKGDDNVQDTVQGGVQVPADK